MRRTGRRLSALAGLVPFEGTFFTSAAMSRTMNITNAYLLRGASTMLAIAQRHHNPAMRAEARACAAAAIDEVARDLAARGPRTPRSAAGRPS